MLFREETTAEVMQIRWSHLALHTCFVFGGKLPLPGYCTEGLSSVNQFELFVLVILIFLVVRVFQLSSVPFLSHYHVEDKAEWTLMATSKR